jgi:glyoxylase-like metal-dependent hydrolase (beta-lactamase superfamily II)
MVRIAWRMLPIPTPLPCVPTRELDPDVDLSSQGVPARALATPGHSPGHLAFLFPGGILFSGDAVVGSSRGPWPVFPMFGDDEAEMKRSIRKLASLEGVEWVFPGHGHPFPHSALREFAAKL